MPSAAAPLPSRRSKTKRQGNFLHLIMVSVKFLISPLVVFWDSFQFKKNLNRSWLFSFFLLTSFMLGLTGVGLLVADGPYNRTLRMMTSITESKEVLSGELQPIIRAINHYALLNKIDPNLIYAIVKTESSFKTTAVSRAGAKGLMQIMPEVWRHYSPDSVCRGDHPSSKLCSPTDCIFTPEANIRVGTLYFRDLLAKYDGRVDLALEAYNAGVTNVIPGLEPKYQETRFYVHIITGGWQELRKMALAEQLQLSLRLQSALKILFGVSFLCWIILFWWANKKLFPK
jgi:hypothetical protein